MQRLQSKWFKKCLNDQEAKDNLEQLIRNSSILLDTLSSILEDEIKEAEAERLSNYVDPNWAYHQADLNGRIRTLRQILSLTKIERTR